MCLRIILNKPLYLSRKSNRNPPARRRRSPKKITTPEPARCIDVGVT
jgi:hypothetical protein